MPLLCFASPKGGVGKTTLAANVACELARAGASVVALDLDPQNALRLHFGLSLHDGAGLMPILRTGGGWRSALRQTKSGVQLLPHGAADMEEALALAEMIRRDPGVMPRTGRDILADPATVLVVDTPPGPSASLSSLLPMTDFLVTVLLADATSVALIPSVEQGRAYGTRLADGPPGRHGYVLNQVNLVSRLSRVTAESVRLQLGARLLGTVSRDESVPEAIAAQRLLGGLASGSRAALDIAALSRVIGSRIARASAPVEPAVARPVHAAGRFNYAGWFS